jgi:Putative transposase/Transposase zinc-binding domain
MLACGNPEKMGYIEYRCLHCGMGKHLVSMSCKSSLCLRCAKVYVDNWVSQVSKMLHAGVIYRHIILTVPAMFRTTFYHNAAVLLSALMRCGAQCLDDFYSEVRGKALRGGSITVLHTHGRNGQYHPHLHLLAPSGGYDETGDRWEHLHYLPYALRRRKWQWYLLNMVRQTLKTEAINQLVDTCFKQYPNGLVTNVQKGQVPSQYQSLARYVAKYVVSPPISVRRIDRYDGERVTYHYRSHRTERVERETVEVATFIGRMIQHAMPKGFKRIRYYGVQATRTFAKVKALIHEALAKVEGVVKGAVQIIAQLTYRQRYEQSTGRDPCICSHCRSEMGVWRIWHPIYGLIHDEGEVIKRGTYASTAPRAGP